MEWFERNRAVMSPAVPVSEGDSYVFYLWTDEVHLIQHIMNLPFVVQVNWYGPSCTANHRQWAEKVAVTARGETAWEEITVILDEHLLGEIWGQALFEIFESDAQQ
jgi:hypothetical protein